MINRVIRTLVVSDFVINFGFGLLAPIFAVFVLQNISGSKLEVIGISTACYWFARTLSTVPLSRFMDRTDGEHDEFYFSVIGTFIAASVPLFYLLMTQPIHLYIIQFIYGLANSMAVPSWRILFTDHLDRGKTGYEWSLEDVAIGLAAGASAYVGALIADRFGFQFLMVLISMIGYVSVMFLVTLRHDIKTLAQIRREKRLEIMLKIKQ